ncbi:MAG: leucine-rich repeat domain-containing protein [Pseudoflavonifractor sp.]|nr:leucine-rich repeat domain-containing protein [Pseudoflavonifractor sp.]
MQINLKKRHLMAVACALSLWNNAVATQIQELEVDGIRYRLEFARPDGTSESRWGANATVIAVRDIAPQIPDYVEYEGIKYYVTRIDDSAFADNNYPYVPLMHLTLPKNCSIDGFVTYFQGVNMGKALQSLTFEDGSEMTTWIPEGCKGLKYVKFPPSDESVSVPGNVHSITTLVLPILCESPGLEMYDSKDLTEVHFGPMTKTIRGFEIRNREREYDYSIYCAAPEPPALGEYEFSEGWYREYYNHEIGGTQYGIPGTLHVPAGCGDKYRNADFWKDFQYIYEDIDFGGNTLSEYTVEDGIVYGLYYNGYVNVAKVVGALDRDLTEASLKSQVMFNGNYYDVTEIADCAFIGCENLSSIEYPWRLNKVGDFAFYKCCQDNDYKLEIAPASVIGNHAYELTNASAYMPDGIVSIGSKSFAGSYSNYYGWTVDVINLPDGLIEIGDEAFANNNRLDVLVVPSTVEHIGERILGSYSQTKHLEFPNPSIKLLGQSTDCFHSYYFDLFELPESVTEIDAFTSAYSRNIVIGHNVTVVRPFALICDRLESVMSLAEVPPTAWTESFGWNPTDAKSYASYATLHVRKGLKWKYAAADGWKEFGEIVDDIDELEQGGFKFRLDLTNHDATLTGMTDTGSESVDVEYPSVIVPDYVTYDGELYPVKRIAKWAIDLTDKRDLTLPATLETIDNFAISNPYTRDNTWTCNALTPPAITDNYAFWSSGDEWWYYNKKDLVVPDEAVETYENTPIWRYLFNIKKKSQTGIDELYKETAADDSDVEFYSIDGIRLTSRPAGRIYIERRSNGKATLKRDI